MGFLKHNRETATLDKWVVFDFDGTIAEATEVLATFWNDYLVKRFNLRALCDADFENMRNMTAIEKIAFTRVPFYKLPFVVSATRKHFPSYMKDLPVIQGFRNSCDLLLARGYRLGILSSNRKENIENYLKRHTFEIFSAVVCDKGFSLFVKHKTIKRFMNEYNVAKENVVYIGDESRDVVACQRAGIPAISVTWGWDSRKVLEQVNGDHLVDHPDQILDQVVHFLGMVKQDN